MFYIKRQKRYLKSDSSLKYIARRRNSHSSSLIIYCARFVTGGQALQNLIQILCAEKVNFNAPFKRSKYSLLHSTVKVRLAIENNQLTVSTQNRDGHFPCI